ncbi:MAG TPA: hypothetical protein VLG50_07590 [Candidatus Saccharimonadales bacterium]|nr:hypothetical protein [Candidatus Saccharimonadales bacterium]
MSESNQSTILFSIVNTNGGEVFIKARPNQSFLSILHNYRKRQGYDNDKTVGFYLNRVQLTDSTKTLIQLNIVNGCVIYAYPATKITFYLAGTNTQHQDCLSDTSRLFVVMNDYKNTYYPGTASRFIYNGHFLTGQETPLSLQMNHNATITVI